MVGVLVCFGFWFVLGCEEKMMIYERRYLVEE